MSEQLSLKRGFRWWQCIMIIVLMSVTVASADSGSGEYARTDGSVQLPEPTGEEEESEQASEASSRDELLRQLREEKSQQLRSYEVSDMEARTRRWEKAKFPMNWLIKGWRGFRPVFGGMPSGSGTVFGGGYIHGLDASTSNTKSMVATPRGGTPCSTGNSSFRLPRWADGSSSSWRERIAI